MLMRLSLHGRHCSLMRVVFKYQQYTGCQDAISDAVGGDKTLEATGNRGTPASRQGSGNCRGLCAITVQRPGKPTLPHDRAWPQRGKLPTLIIDLPVWMSLRLFTRERSRPFPPPFNYSSHLPPPAFSPAACAYQPNERSASDAPLRQHELLRTQVPSS